VRHSPALALAGLTLGCLLSTTRPGFDPLVGTQQGELRLLPREATERLADALRRDSIPVSRIELRDGYLETRWFDGATGKPIGHSPLGVNDVRVRGWVDPGRFGHADLRVEVAYRAYRDPSVPERELERPPPADHPAMRRVKSVLDSLEKRYGDPIPPPVVPDTEPAPQATDTSRAPSPQPPDSVHRPADSTPPPVDSVKPRPGLPADSLRRRRPSPTPRAGPG
jgi:hypothetical protein